MDIENIVYTDESVLVVDDEEFIREPVVAMLEHLGFKADGQGNGQEALERLEENQYTFLLTEELVGKADRYLYASKEALNKQTRV